VAAYGWPFFVAACLIILQDSLAFLQPQLLRMLLVYISDYQDSQGLGEAGVLGPSQGFLIATTMFIAGLIQSIILGQACFIGLCI
jgi:ATP-binding cassette, subfamily C (CFTR/MRP), member 1